MAVVYVNNITVDTGEDFDQDFDLLETGGATIDLTNYTAKAQIRKHPESSTSISFTIGFPDRSNGKISLSIPSWTTSKLKPGRYVYDVLVTKPGGTKEVVLEGSVLARAGISTGCAFSLPNSAQRTCIAVIDESYSTQTYSGMESKWNQFRESYPNRIFYLLQPTPIGAGHTNSSFGSGFGNQVDTNNYDAMRCPDSFLAETTVNVEPLI